MRDSNKDYIFGYLQEAQEIIERLKVQKDVISDVIKILFQAWLDNRWVFIIGNGGSASTAIHFAADLIKTTIDLPGQRGLRTLDLVGNVPLASATTNDWGWDKVYDAPLITYWEPGSVLVAFSVHGGSGQDRAGAWSQNLLRAIQFAKDNKGTTIGFSGFDGGAMKTLCDRCVVIPADSTPQVESFHVVLHHLIAFRLKEMIFAHYRGE